jgi:fibronectin type 3 domain-containing protein
MKGHINVLLPLLAAALVLTGCTNPLEPPAPESGAEGSYVELRLETPFNSTARTIYPVFPDISKYDLTFSGTGTHEPLTLNSGGPHRIALDAGAWTITVTAFTGTEGAYSILARGSASVTVIPGQTSEVTISLSPAPGEAGSFRYALSIPEGAAGNLVITTPEGGTVKGGTITLGSGTLNSGVLNLPTGQYLMNISLILGDRRAGRTEALHIYPHQESLLECRFFEHDFRLVSNLAYNRWEEQTLASGEVHWYRFTTSEETAYRVQWNGAPPQGDGTKTLPVLVSAYTGDDTSVFENKNTGWVSPETVSGIQGTVYLRVQGANGIDSGSYALRYYDPAEMPPQEGINLSINTLPVPPRNLVSWNGVSGADGYRLYRTTDPAAGYNQIGEFNSTSYTDTSVFSEITYYYRVSAYNALGEGEKSPAITATPPSAVSLSEKAWAEGTLGAGETQWYTFTPVFGAAYKVQWNGAAPQGDGTRTLPAVVSAYTSGGALVFENKTEGWTSAETVSGQSGIVCLKVEGANGAGGSFAIRYYNPKTTPSLSPAAPMISAGDGAIEASWEAVDWADTYEIYYSTGTTMPASPAQIVPDTTATITITGLINGTTYYVWVKAKNSKGESDFSPAASGKPIGNMGTVSLTVVSGELRVSWAAVAGADRYEIYCYTDMVMPDTPSQTVTDTTATLTERFDGTPYNVWVKPGNEWGTGGPSAPVSVVPATGVSLNKSDAVIIAGGAETLTATVFPSTASNPAVSWSSSNPDVATVSAEGRVTAIAFGTTEITTATVDGEFTDACTVTVPPVVLYVDGAANPESSFTSLEGAFTWLNDNAESNTAYTIVLYQNTTMPARILSCSETNVGITIKGDSSERSIQLSGTGSLFTINSGLTLAVENLSLQGGTSNTSALISVNGGSLEMRQDSLIMGNYGISGNGGGVYVSSGTFTMQDNASVSGNTAGYSSSYYSYGGGVYVSSGTFTMQDNASVSGNTAYYGGGVYVGYGTFTKKGGTIYGDTNTTHTADSTENTATSGNGHAVYLGSNKKRNSTAGTTRNLYAQYTGSAWTYNDTSVGGAGNTSTAWE